MQTTSAPSKSNTRLWTGRIISILCVLFLLFDASGKLFKESHSVSGTMALGFTEEYVPVIGIILLVCTLVYIIPRTALIGAVLLTAYLGGAVVAMMRVGTPFYFPVLMGVLLWTGLFLRDERVRAMVNRS